VAKGILQPIQGHSGIEGVGRMGMPEDMRRDPAVSGLAPEPGDDPCRARAGPASSGPGPEAVSSKTRWHPSACRAARWAVKDSCITRSGDGESKPRTLFTGLYQVHKPRSGHNVHNYVTVVLPPPNRVSHPQGPSRIRRLP
jgi:hypothetical protein